MWKSATVPHSSSFLAGLLPSVSLPIFTSGTLRANLSRKEAEFDEQAARYNKNVYTALREAADALTQYETAAAAVRDQTEMTALARKNAAAAQSRYRAGLDNKLDWLAAQDENPARRSATWRRHRRSYLPRGWR